MEAPDVQTLKTKAVEAEAAVSYLAELAGVTNYGHFVLPMVATTDASVRVVVRDAEDPDIWRMARFGLGSNTSLTARWIRDQVDANQARSQEPVEQTEPA